MKDIRETILNYLRERGEATVAELAAQVDLTPVSMHYHLGRLESEGLIAARSERHGVGRPKSIYSLADAALELFPQANHRLTNRLLSVLQEQMNEQQMEQIFTRMVDDIAQVHRHKFEGKPIEDRLEALVEIMGTEGFMARVTRNGEDFQLTQCGCPYQSVAEQHPGICTIDLQLINTTLGTKVERESWILNGDHVCTFNIKATAEA